MTIEAIDSLVDLGALPPPRRPCEPLHITESELPTSQRRHSSILSIAMFAHRSRFPRSPLHDPDHRGRGLTSCFESRSLAARWQIATRASDAPRFASIHSDLDTSDGAMPSMREFLKAVYRARSREAPDPAKPRIPAVQVRDQVRVAVKSWNPRCMSCPFL